MPYGCFPRSAYRDAGHHFSPKDEGAAESFHVVGPLRQQGGHHQSFEVAEDSQNESRGEKRWRIKAEQGNGGRGQECSPQLRGIRMIAGDAAELEKVEDVSGRFECNQHAEPPKAFVECRPVTRDDGSKYAEVKEGVDG